MLWFFYRLFHVFFGELSEIELFDKGSFYMLGVGMGLLVLGLVTIIEFWGGNPITTKQNIIFTRLAILAVALMFVVPHVAHFSADRYLEEQGYSVCEEASHQWLFVSNIVYVADSVECSADLKSYNKVVH